MSEVRTPVRRPLPSPQPVTTNTSEAIEAQLAAAREAIAALPAVRSAVLAACGGSFALLLPVEHFLSTQTGSLNTVALNAAEFTSRGSALVGSETVVILCSHSGTTPETVTAAEYARARGALTVAFTNDPESPLAEAADHVITYQHGENKDPSYTGPPLALRLAAGLLADLEGLAVTGMVDDAVKQLPGILAAAEKRYRPIADQWAFERRGDKLIYTLSAGANFGPAYAFSICLLQEMLWIHSAAIHAGEFFHGPLEIADVDVTFIATLGLDGTRDMEQRAIDFVQARSKQVLVIDAAEFGLERVDQQIRGAVAHLVLGPVLRIFADELADHTGHPLSVRRYMWRMDY